MTSNGQTHDTAEIRKLLAAAFDDVGLVALCQDEFPDLCESLGRGLRKEEILNVILDHFRRRGDFGPLLAAVQLRKPGLYVQFEPTPRAQTRPSTVETTPVSGDQGFLNRVYQVLRDPVWQGVSAIVGILACIVAVLAILPMQTVLWPPTPTLAPSPTIRITMPITRVLCRLNDPCTFAVTGTSSGVASDPNLKVVVFVNPDPGQSVKWWPQPSTSIQSDGTWQGHAQIGYTPCWPIGDDFQIVAVVMTVEQANRITTDSQLLPQEYVARSDVVDLVTAYAPVKIDLSRASASSDIGSSITITAIETSLEISYDLGTGGWVQVTISATLDANNLDLSCMKKQGAFIAFSLEGTGAANSFEVKVEDTDGTNYGWLSAPGESVTPNRPLRLPLASLVYWWGGTDTTMNWQQVKNIMFAVSKKTGDEGSKGQVIVTDVVITP